MKLHFLQRLSALGILTLSIAPFANASDENLLDDDFLLSDDSDFSAPNIENSQNSWKDYFVTSFSHDQTRTDEGETSYFRYAVRVEYEQAFAEGWFARADIKGTSYRSLDKQAFERAKNKVPAGEIPDPNLAGESYEKAKLQQAWVQYSRGKCVHKLGQQTLLWGQVDGTFAVDDITPFDFTEQLLTDYSSIRLAQPMLASECFMQEQQLQIFYIPNAKLHLSNHNNDQYGLSAALGIDDEDLDSEWGVRYQFAFGKTELAFMFADLIANQPSQILIPSDPTSPSIPTQNPNPTLTPELALAEYKLYGMSANYSSGAWQLKTDIGYKTDQIVDGTLSEITDIIDIATGVEYLSPSNHSFNAGIWGAYAFEDEIAAEQNDSTPFITLRWNKSYLNDDLDMSMLASGRSNPKSMSATAQANFQYDDYWSFSSAITFADADEGVSNPLQSQNNELSLQIKYQF